MLRTTTTTTTTTRLLPWSTTRAYAVSIQPAKLFPGKAVPRQYPEKKATLYHRYARLLEASSSSTLIFLLHTDFTAQRLAKLRKDIIVAAGHPPPSLASLSPKKPVSSDPSTRLPTVTILRTSIFGAALRDFARVST